MRKETLATSSSPLTALGPFPARRNRRSRICPGRSPASSSALTVGLPGGPGRPPARVTEDLARRLFSTCLPTPPGPEPQPRLRPSTNVDTLSMASPGLFSQVVRAIGRSRLQEPSVGVSGTERPERTATGGWPGRSARGPRRSPCPRRRSAQLRGLLPRRRLAVRNCSFLVRSLQLRTARRLPPSEITHGIASPLRFGVSAALPAHLISLAVLPLSRDPESERTHLE